MTQQQCVLCCVGHDSHYSFTDRKLPKCLFHPNQHTIIFQINETFKITSSGNTTIFRYSNSSRRIRISRIGFDCDFLAMAHTPTTTCLPSSPVSKSSSPKSVRLPCNVITHLQSLCYIVTRQFIPKTKML